MSSFIRYWNDKSVTAAGWAFDKVRNKLTSSPPRLASAFRTCCQNCALNAYTTHDRRQLEMISYEYEAVRQSQWADARRQSDLRSLVHDAKVKLASKE